ncbi:MAG: ABC transporter permease subunit, partial [Planctomycetaceae bacterium]|nr:ABC transporter permease subunit [Planctomycetaceae bacterium]
MSALSADAQDTLETIRQRGTLIWGADQEGGGPFVFPRDDDPTQIQGFEVDFAEYLSAKLGVRAQFQQGQWDKLPDLLDRGDIDVVLNGYEWTPSRAARYGTSIPYYVYELQLLARVDDATLNSCDDLARPREPKWRVAVLGGSAADDYLAEHFPETVEIVRFDGATDAMRAVELAVDGIDANLQDLPVAVFYRDGFPRLKHAGPPVGSGDYVALVRNGDEPLLAAVNEAIISGLRDGSLRRIFERYGLWNSTQVHRGLETNAQDEYVPTGAGAVDAGDAPRPEPPAGYIAERGWDVIRTRGPLLLKATAMTVLLSVTSMPLAVLCGLLLALGRLFGPGWLRWPMTTYVEVIRGTPLVLQLYVIFFLLPEIGVSINAFWAAVIGLAINYSAYESEIYRAGIQAVPRGQMEAALALGMSKWLALRRVIVPQATRLVIPPVTNDFIALFKDTAVCSVITVVELSKEYYIQARSTGAILELGLLTCLLYLALSYPLSLLTGIL